MKYLELQKQLKSLKKPFYTMADFEKITGMERRNLSVTLSRLTKKGLLVRLTKGVFILPDDLDKLPEIANQLYSPSYLSFESALSIYGILSQYPYTITFATPKRSKRIRLADKEVEYRQIKPSLFISFMKQDNLFVATPEKALLDQLYLVSKGVATLSNEELDLSFVDKKKILKLSKTFPEYVQEAAREVLKILENRG